MSERDVVLSNPNACKQVFWPTEDASDGAFYCALPWGHIGPHQTFEQVEAALRAAPAAEPGAAARDLRDAARYLTELASLSADGGHATSLRLLANRLSVAEPWAAPAAPGPSDEELARHASRAYQMAAQHGEDQWVAVARMMRSWLLDGPSVSDARR